MQEDRAGAQDWLPTKTLAPNSERWGGVERKREHTKTDGSTSEQQKLYDTEMFNIRLTQDNYFKMKLSGSSLKVPYYLVCQIWYCTTFCVPENNLFL